MEAHNKNYLLRIKSLYEEKDEVELTLGVVLANLTAEKNTALLAAIIALFFKNVYLLLIIFIKLIMFRKFLFELELNYIVVFVIYLYV